MNVIIEKLARIAPGYEPTSAQIRAAEKADDPQAVADSLEAEIDAIKDLMREKLDLEEPPFKQVIKLVDFERKFVSISGVSALWLLHQSGVVDAYKIGRESVLDDAPSAINALYWDILGRAPEPEGLAEYQRQFASGRPRWEIVREIELSDEALARKESLKD